MGVRDVPGQRLLVWGPPHPGSPKAHGLSISPKILVPMGGASPPPWYQQGGGAGQAGGARAGKGYGCRGMQFPGPSQQEPGAH